MAEPEKTVATEGNEKAAAGGEKKVGKFSHGDHMVHLLIQQGKKFLPPIAGDR